MIHIRLSILVLVALALLATPAAAATPTQILRDCVLDGSLDGNYSAEDLAAARRALPADADEYSDCRSQLRDAERRAAAGGRDGDGTGGPGGGTTDGGVPTGGGTTSGGAPPVYGGGGFNSDDPAVAVGDRAGLQFAGTDGERARLDSVRAKPGEGVRIDGRAIRPDAAGIGAVNLTHELPAPLIAALAALAGALLALTLPPLRRRVAPALPALRRRVPSRSRRGGD